ncbi:MAG: winged helix-turn-helix transcriptional regulator, partial [Spirochaetes bacterium]|nr:winged helix-turn-helix transcriptional regulator [Spirochaetota bacterium]
FAGAVMEDHGGTVPDTAGELVKLPGIGGATASSIAVFAFNRPEPFIETNVRAVFIHFFFPCGDAVTDGSIAPLVARAMDRRNPRKWYSALMDYGTMPKRLYPNPGRRSSHHRPQPPFRGSRRELRGRVLRCLLERQGITMAKLAERCDSTPQAIRGAVEMLVEEGLLRRHRGRYWIA